eukprot:s6130_g2.t1
MLRTVLRQPRVHQQGQHEVESGSKGLKQTSPSFRPDLIKTYGRSSRNKGGRKAGTAPCSSHPRPQGKAQNHVRTEWSISSVHEDCSTPEHEMAETTVRIPSSRQLLQLAPQITAKCFSYCFDCWQGYAAWNKMEIGKGQRLGLVVACLRSRMAVNMSSHRR